MHYSKNFKALWLGCLLLPVFANLSQAQNNVSVNTLTGTAGVSIPFYTITSGNAGVPIGLSYTANGIKPKDVEGTVGMGFNLTAGGAVRRVVRGLPDDIKKDSLGNTLLGWMYNSNQATINGHTFANNGSTCSNETADISFITSNFSNLYDTEPDLFYVDAPGLSVKLVYDQSIGNFRPVPYQDLVIKYTTDATRGLITSFTISNDKGMKYYFSRQEKVIVSTDLVNNSSGVVNYFNNKYAQYKNTIRYSDAWMLSSIADATSSFVSILDTMISVRHSTDKVNLYIGGSTTASLQYNIRTTVYQEVPFQIATANTAENNVEVTFNWTFATLKHGNNLPYLRSIAGQGDTITFACDPVRYINGTDTTDKVFLHSIYDKGCGSPVNYAFSYSGETYNSGNSTYYTTLSDSVSKQWDYWGYNKTVNYSIPAIYVDPSSAIGYPRYAIATAGSGGTNYPYTVGNTSSYMTADTVNETAGTLNKITYALGGTTTIQYQSNDYVDLPSGTTVKGGGIRVERITDYNGLDVTKNVVHNYSYINPSTLASSGKPVTLPAYAFTIPYTGGATGQALWAYSTAISDVDLSPENHSIVYPYSRVTQTNAGSTLYQYYVPATNWDVSATPDCNTCTTEWLPTYDYMGRTSCTSSYGQVKNDYYGYPFIPNPNYDFERGLLKQVIAYTDARAEASEADYTYQRSYSSPAAIPALKFDYNTGTTGVLGYNKYVVYTATSELTAQVTKKVYDLQTLSQAQQSTVNFTYGSPYHKLVTKQTVTNSDNSILISNINYIKDFVADSGSNANVLALYKLQQQNINVPVESWQQVQIGSTIYTTKATLALFALAQPIDIYNSFYLPSKTFSFLSPDGVTNFTPYTVSGQSTTRYSGYPSAPVVNYLYYDNVGSLQTTDDGHHHKSTSLMDYASQEPALTAANTAVNCIAFNDFDSQIVPPFDYFGVSGTPVYVADGHTGRGVVFTTTDTLSATAITKDSLANNYIFSIWLNTGSVSGTLAVTITPASGTPATYNESFAATGNKWVYFEWKIPVTSFNGTFTPLIKVTGGSIDIDDVLLYPENAQVTTYGHDPVTHFANASTNTNGITTYYLVDKWGRLMYAYDRDKNILKKNTYVFPRDITGFTGAGTLSARSSTVNFDTNASITLSTSNQSPCDASATTYKWDFGDGYIVTTTSYQSPAHAYLDSGTYTAKLTLTSPVFGVFTSTLPVHIVPGTMNLSIVTNAINRATLYNMNFYQGGVLVYNVTPANIASMHPLKEAYNIVVTFTSNSYQYVPATGWGFNSIGIIAGTTINLCENYSSSNSYSFTVNFNHSASAYFNISISACSGGGGD